MTDTITTRTPKQLELDKLVDELREKEAEINKVQLHIDKMSNAMYAMKEAAHQLRTQIRQLKCV